MSSNILDMQGQPPYTFHYKDGILNNITQLLDKPGDEGFKEAFAKALSDRDINADPYLVEILKNPKTGHASMLDPTHIIFPITKGNIISPYVSSGDISSKSKPFMILDASSSEKK